MSMFSMPPAIVLDSMPTMISCAAETIAWAPEPHTRLTVIAGTSIGMPPLTADCRAGFILLPAWITFPITTVLIFSGSSFDRSKLPRTAVAPSSVAGTDFRLLP
jgi:hypothetical protein